MSKGGGGGYDTSAMEAATNRGIDLQEKIYEEGRDLSKPWYNAGSSAVGRLSDLLGLSGGSVKSREDIYSQLLPQYTSQSSTSSALPEINSTYERDPSIYYNSLSPEQKSYIAALRPDIAKGTQRNRSNNYTAQGFTADDIRSILGGMPSSGASTVDYQGLNAAVDAQLANQEKPADYGTLGKAFSMQDYVEDPGYQFRLAEGQKGLDRSLAARGKTFSGEAAKAAADYNSGMASQEYGNAYNRYNTDQNNLYNMLAGVSGLGQNAAQSQVQQGQQYVQGVNDLTTSLANAQTAAAQAKASRPSLFSQLAGTAAQAAGAYFSDKRLKENIRELEEIDGVKRYEFTYKDDPSTVYTGAMAQQVLDVIPDAVFIGDDGYMLVDYNRLPFNMEVVSHGRA